MSDQRLRVAVIGVGGVGARSLEAVRQCRHVELVAVGDKSAAVVEAAAREAGVPGYTDNRSLLAEARPQIALLCLPPMAAPELVAACAERDIHVWKELPLARSLTEGAEMVRRMDARGLKLAVGTQRRFAPGYRLAGELIGELQQLSLARAHYLFNWGPDLDWRGDRASAGGGALLELGYQPIDLLTGLLGVPEEVYGTCVPSSGGEGRRSWSTASPPYDTEDTAAAVLRYRSGVTATVVTTRCSGPVSEGLVLHGRGGSLSADWESCLLRDPDGNVREHLKDSSPPNTPFGLQLDAFAQAVASGAGRYECSGWENLLNLAVIDALYLSDRTKQPENVLELLKSADLKPDDCLRCRPEPPPGPPEAGTSGS